MKIAVLTVASLIESNRFNGTLNRAAMRVHESFGLAT